ncbi:accessory factor UbiK family protein [Neisseria montereyensis]|uniref:Ubiquinone biosynthesis accessory factor UbiK n=1 Tax=Neisseria montereyensis TaxID=2973938 RepID=A0ABT2FD77_9NEIS|nr:accessory factor UbiK family protein [Neisseria montereyensis]MCS4534116.1 accessory factor UbiK family protein [Neisseria montereyensis]
MIGKKIFEEVSAKLGETIANSPAKDVEKNVKAMLGSAFNRMDLVTREEFDIQQQVLIKTRTKLTELEERLAKLEGGQPPEQVETTTVPPAAENTEQTDNVEENTENKAV